jgi:hypothetical protein
VNIAFEILLDEMESVVGGREEKGVYNMGN